MQTYRHTVYACFLKLNFQILSGGSAFFLAELPIMDGMDDVHVQLCHCVKKLFFFPRIVVAGSL